MPKLFNKIERVRLAGAFGNGLLDREVHGVRWGSGRTLCGESTGYDYPPQFTQDEITCLKCKKGGK